MLSLYAIRHGESESNFAGVYCGWGDVSLTKKGIGDAIRAGKQIENVCFERVYTSDLKRAVQTCQVALSSDTYEQSQLLREINMGDLCGLNFSQALQKYGTSYCQHLLKRDFTAYGGENTDMQYDRTAKFMSNLEKKELNGNVAVFCHEGTIKCMLRYVLQSKIPWNRYSVDNGAITVFSWNGEQWKLNVWNYTCGV